MKIAKLADLDALPTILGAITLLDLALFNAYPFDSLRPIGFVFLISLALAATSLLSAVLKHRKFNALLWTNIAWLIFGMLVVGYYMSFQRTYVF